MLAEGKITADEAERLVDALDREQPEAPPGAAPRPNPRPRYLRVVVGGDSGGDRPSGVNIRAPRPRHARVAAGTPPPPDPPRPLPARGGGEQPRGRRARPGQHPGPAAAA